MRGLGLSVVALFWVRVGGIKMNSSNNKMVNMMPADF